MTSNQKTIVAVIDDDLGMRTAVSNLLSASGYDTETFDSAEAFLKAVASCEASCLVLDIQLGDISGVELAHQLAADGFNFPIIFMSGLKDETIRRQADAAGGIAFLSKPFPAQLLIDTIERAIR